MRKPLFLITFLILVSLILFSGCLGGKKEVSEQQELTSSQPEQQSQESGIPPTLGEEINELNVSDNENIDAIGDDLYIESDIF